MFKRYCSGGCTTFFIVFQITDVAVGSSETLLDRVPNLSIVVAQFGKS